MGRNSRSENHNGTKKRAVTWFFNIKCKTIVLTMIFSEEEKIIFENVVPVALTAS